MLDLAYINMGAGETCCNNKNFIHSFIHTLIEENSNLRKWERELQVQLYQVIYPVYITEQIVFSQTSAVWPGVICHQRNLEYYGNYTFLCQKPEDQAVKFFFVFK